jgi:hypothetical protein
LRERTRITGKTRRNRAKISLIPEDTATTLTVLLAERPSGAEATTKNMYLVLNAIILALSVNIPVVIVGLELRF